MKNNVYIDEKDPNIPSQSRNLLLNVVNELEPIMIHDDSHHERMQASKHMYTTTVCTYTYDFSKHIACLE